MEPSKQTVKYEITAALRELTSSKANELDESLGMILGFIKNSANWEVMGSSANIEVWKGCGEDEAPLDEIFDALKPYSDTIWLDESIFNVYTVFEK